MWKVLAGVVVATAVIAGSATLYSQRHRLFRPDVTRVGGTRVVLDVAGDANAVAAVLRRRFDPKDAEGIVIRAEEGRVEVDVPNGRNHDENLDRVRRLADRAGRLRTGILAHDQDDAEAVAAGKKWLADAANRKALEDAHSKGEPFPDFPGEFKGTGPAAPTSRYEWVWLNWGRAAVTHGKFGTTNAAAKGYLAIAHVPPVVAGYAATVFTLLRSTADGVTNEDVVRPQVQYLSRAHFGIRLQLRFEGDGWRRLLDLSGKQMATPAANPRRMALALDNQVLYYRDLTAKLLHNTFDPVVDSMAEGEGVIGLIRAPLPDGVRVKVVGEEALPGR